MTIRISIHHRVDRPFEEIEPGTAVLQTLSYAFAYSAAVPVVSETNDDFALLDQIFDACGNCPHSMFLGWNAVQNVHTRSQLRSLSVGDIVVIERHARRAAYTVQRAGWKCVPSGITTGRFAVDYPSTH